MNRSKIIALATLVVAAIFAGTVLARTDWKNALATSPLELIPANDDSPELGAVRQLAGDAQARVMLAEVTSPSGRAAEAAGVVAETLANDAGTPGVVALNPLDMASRRDTGKALFEERFALLFPKWLARARLDLGEKNATPEALSGYAADRLDAFMKTDAAFAFEKLLPADPLLLLPDATAPLLREAGPKPEPGRALLWIDTHRAPLSHEGQAPVFAALGRAQAAMRARVPDAAMRSTGVNAFAAASERGIRREMEVLNIAALVAVACVCAIRLRSPAILAHITPVTLLSVAHSWAITLLLFGRIHVFAVALGALLSGVCVDFTLYVMLHDGADGRPASFDRLRPVLKPLFSGGLVAVAGFAFLTLSPLPAIRQTGVFAATGIFSALIFSVAYGSLVRFRQRRRESGETPPSPEPEAGRVRRSAGPGRLLRFAPWACAPLVAGVFLIPWNDSLRDLEYPLPELRKTDREIRAAFGETGRTMWLVSGCDTGDALRRLGEFDAGVRAATGGKSGARGPMMMLATPAEYAAADRFLREDGEAFATAFAAALKRHEYDPADFKTFLDACREARGGLPAYGAATERFLGALTGPESMLVSRRGDRRLLVCWTDAGVKIPEPPASSEVFPLNRLESLNRTLGRYRENMLTLCLAGFAVTMLVSVAVRRRLDTLRDFAAPVLVTLSVAGLAGWCRAPLSMFHLSGAFLALCCSLNYSVFARTARAGNRPFPAAVTLAWATSALSFGALCFSRIPALFSLGATVVTILTATYLTVRFTNTRRA